VIKLGEANSDAYYEIALASYNLKRYKTAIINYDKAIELGIEALDVKVSTYSTKGDCLYNIKNYKAALESYNKAIEFDPTNYVHYYDKAYTLDNLKRYQEALENYDKVILLNPSYLSAYVNKADIFLN